jgi:hypothetical protein
MSAMWDSVAPGSDAWDDTASATSEAETSFSDTPSIWAWTVAHLLLRSA